MTYQPYYRTLRRARAVNVLAAGHFGVFVAFRCFPDDPALRWSVVSLALVWAACVMIMAPSRAWAWWGALTASLFVCVAVLLTHLFLILLIFTSGAYFSLSLMILLPLSFYYLLAARPDP